MPTQGFVQLPTDAGNTGKKEDHAVLPSGNYREVVVIGDPSTDAAYAPVDSTNGLTVQSVVLGTTTDSAVTGDNTGTVSAKLRGLSKMIADVWDSTNHWLKVSIQNTSLAITAASLPLPSGASTDAALKPSLTIKSLQVTASGDTTLLASGTRKIHRVKMCNSHATTALVAGLKIPSQNSGNAFDLTYLPAAGGQAVFTFPGGYIAATSEAVSVNLSASGQVETTIYYE
jgi:hypothetical protein